MFRLLILVAAMVVPLVLIGFPHRGEPTSYGDSTLYFKSPITREQAESVGALLETVGIFADGREETVQLVEERGTRYVRIVRDPGLPADGIEDLIGSLDGPALSLAIGGRVKVQFSDAAFVPFKTF